jgi:PTS system galactitol-specific IIA component
MQYHLINLVHEENILVGLKADSAEETIRALANVLVKPSRIELAYADDVWAREQSSPTGLPTMPLAVAIPHADPGHVLQSSVAIGVLSRPVPFGLMGGTNGQTVEASVVFLLAIKETEKQVLMIQELLSILQTPDHLTRLAQALTPAEVKQVLA